MSFQRDSIVIALTASLLSVTAAGPAGAAAPEPRDGDVIVRAARAAREKAAKPEGETKPAAPAEPRPIRPEDYGKWESLGFRSALSPDGKWLAYQVSRTDGDGELRVRMLATVATETIPHGSRPLFSRDNNWLACAIGVSVKEREKLQKSKQPVRSKLGLRSLTTGEMTEIENVASFSFSDDGKYLVMRRYPMKGRTSGGVDIVLRDLATGVSTNFGNVATYAFNDDGALLAMVIDAEDKAGNGIQVFDVASGILRTIDSVDAKYGNLTWREDAADLAVLREMEHEKDEDVSHVVVTWRGLDGERPRKRAYDHTEDEGFPDELRVVDLAGLRWADEGGAVFFGVKGWEKKQEGIGKGDGEEKEKEKEKENDQDKDQDKDKDKEKKKAGGTLRETLKDPSNVEVWHAADIDIIPMQKRTAGREERRSHLAAWWIDDDRLVRLGDDTIEGVRLLEGQLHAIGSDNTPHEAEKRFGPTLSDRYLIDVRTGDRKKILERNKYFLGSSPDGMNVLYQRDGRVWSYDVESDAHRDLTGNIETNFVNQETSTLTDEKRVYGIGGWFADSSRVLLYDRYDIWSIAADGSSAERFTRGAADRIRHRRTIIDREADEFVDPVRPTYLSLYGDRTKASGYGRITIADGPGSVERIVYEDQNIGRIVKAEDADVYAVVKQAFDDSPDIFVGGADLAGLRQATETNPFQKEYRWGHSELVDYTSATGEALQGALFYPAGYEPEKQYPMIVYIYELVSQGVHRYSVPSERSAYNTAVLTAEGYFVFQPDIVYRPQNPGLSAVDCVVPAVETVIETGMVDPDGIGLVGHSWGAYQTAFIVTQTDLFAAGIAGAPLTNMMSMSMSIYWNSGQTDAWIFHESQGRMDRPFWRDVETYIANSPIFSIDDLETPLLIAFGTEDGAVDFNQGVEMYNAARLVGKPLVMLVYPGENHGLAKKENQVDYHYRILDWFGHYLKRDEAPQWITEGVPHLERKKEIEAAKKGK